MAEEGNFGMFSGRRWYGLVVLIMVIDLIYVMYMNYIHDPFAAEFLKHKIGLKKEVQLPLWLHVLYVHIGFACLAMITGALNFSQRLLSRHRRFHRINGYVYLVSILLVDLTSGYMAPYATGGRMNSIAFNLLNLLWPIFTVGAIVHIKKKRLIKHWEWMMRSYALCFTNFLTHLITAVISRGFGWAYPASYSIGVYGAVILLLLTPELLIRRQRKHREP